MPGEAKLEATDAGLVPAGPGWFVMNARDARWVDRPGRGRNAPLTGWTEHEAESWFTQLGVNLTVLGPGEPIGMYHWEADAEGFLVLSGEALLIVEGEERPLRQWDFVHCPPETQHMIVGAGDGPCVILCASSREHIGEHCNGGAYTVDETAIRHEAGVRDEAEAEDPYGRYPEPTPVPYSEGTLPGDG
jgi:uncharacterized cupin superfamily protein